MVDPFCFAFIWFRVQGLRFRVLETEVPQRDFRVWPNPKRRLACLIRRLPVRPNGPRHRRRIECIEEAQLYAVV